MPGCICNECTNYGEETACLSVINIEFSNITAVSFGVTWEPSNSNAVSYVIEYKESTSTTWLILPAIPAPTAEGTVVGLTPDTVYDFRIVTVCTDNRSCYSLTHRLRTLELETT